MKFSTQGDGGETSLLGSQRVPKYDARPDAYGTLDEASSVLGVARAATNNRCIKDIILGVQKDLLVMGAELSALPEDMWRLTRRIGEADVHHLEEIIDELQREVQLKHEFIYSGETLVSAYIDVGRTVIRRAERKAVKLKHEEMVNNVDIHKYLNRLADLLFVLARYEEQKG